MSFSLLFIIGLANLFSFTPGGHIVEVENERVITGYSPFKRAEKRISETPLASFCRGRVFFAL